MTLPEKFTGYTHPRHAIHRALTEINLDEIEKLDEQFATATVQELKAIWGRFSDQRPSDGQILQSSLAYKVLLSNLASKDGQFAAESLCSNEDCKFAASSFSLVMEAWAHQDAKAASSWYLDDARATLRKSEKLVAGQRFANSVYNHLATNDNAALIKSIDSLHSTQEIWGAIEGLRSSYKESGIESAKLLVELQSLETNSTAAKSVFEFQKTADQLKKLKDVDLRNDLHNLFQSEMQPTISQP
ncbi:MAG: hypothetical protein JNL58_30110 [Planctomyces sp.]|nr:hypothetical protein [Planctomyces sp.]